MKKEELRTAIQEMNTYQFGQKKELTNKLSKVTSYVAKQEVLDFVSQLDKQGEPEITEEQAWNKISESYPVSSADVKEGLEKFAFSGSINLSNWVKLSKKEINENHLSGKKELLKEIEGHLKETEGENASGTFDQGYEEGMDYATALIEHHIKEPELPVIPQFVADYIESARRENATLLGAMDHFLNTKEIKSWMRVNQELFAKAWLSKDGYTIEPEKKYILKNKRGFVSSIQVKQSRNDLTSNIIFNYTPYQQDAYKFSQKEKEFYKDSFYLEEDEVTN